MPTLLEILFIYLYQTDYDEDWVIHELFTVNYNNHNYGNECHFDESYTIMYF